MNFVLLPLAALTLFVATGCTGKVASTTPSPHVGSGGLGGGTGASAGDTGASGGTASTGTTGGSGGVTAGSGGATGGSGGTTGGSGGTTIIEPVPCEPTLDSIQSVIIRTSCSANGCHGTTRPAVRLDLTVSDLEPALINVSSATCGGWALVVPGSPEQSFLYQKLTQSVPGCDGERMPLDGILPDNQIECIAGWIRSLAPGGCETCGGASCVSLSSDPANCGVCNQACPMGTSCVDGTCACPGGQLACGDACVDPLTDPLHCGTCETVCASGSSCSGGACTCSGSLESCAGACIDLTSNPAHCGDCGTACDDGAVCLNGACSSGCGSLTQCGSSCADLDTSAVHCGGCDSPCDAPRSCIDGACSCPAGQELCGNACVDTQTDAANCGACGASCGPGSTCAGGTCECGASEVSFASQVQPIFSANCTDAGCHSGMRPKEGLSLEPGKAYPELVGVGTSQCGSGRQLVVAGQVGESYLLNKLLGTELCGGSQMPKAGQSLSDAELAAITAWICQGAPNN